MKNILHILFILLICQPLLAQNKQTPPVAKAKGVNWISLEEAQVRMKTEPRKVYIDLYTDWCGWCKVMDKKTFSHAKVIEFMNEHYYCIHLNAESKDTLVFNGEKFGILEGSNTNALAMDWMQNRLSYPTSIFFDENFLNPQPIPGYLEVPTMEMILKYIAGNFHKNTPWPKWQKEFKGEWK
ncbi:MAG: DUF255 domain-containing protein [Chitinophagaceae bacterium]|nr:DUF255 domain-containing protein [Chitinophagaceae bacterium]